MPDTNEFLALARKRVDAAKEAGAFIHDRFQPSAEATNRSARFIQGGLCRQR